MGSCRPDSVMLPWSRSTNPCTSHCRKTSFWLSSFRTSASRLICLTAAVFCPIAVSRGPLLYVSAILAWSDLIFRGERITLPMGLATARLRVSMAADSESMRKSQRMSGIRVVSLTSDVSSVMEAFSR